MFAKLVVLIMLKIIINNHIEKGNKTGLLFFSQKKKKL